jgi:hypothetical protein
MSRLERDLLDQARTLIAAEVCADFPGWTAAHDRYGWRARRLDDGHEVRAAGPDGLRALICAMAPFSSRKLTDDLRRAHPGWLVWADAHGWWHARRQGNFQQEHAPGSPLYALHEPTAAALRERLAVQDAGPQNAG